MNGKTNLETALQLYRQYHGTESEKQQQQSQAIVERTDTDKPAYLDSFQGLTAVILKKLQSEEIISETDAQTIQQTIQQTLSDWAADRKKTALLNLIASVAVPLVLQYFLKKRGDSTEQHQ